MGAPALRTGATVTCVAIVATVVAHLVAPSGTVGDLSYLAGAAVASATAWLGVAITGRPVVSVLIAIGVSVTAAGDAVDRLFGWTGAVGWIPAVAYFVGYLALGAAMLGALAPSGDQRRLMRIDAILEAATILTVALMLLWATSTTGSDDPVGLSVSEQAVQLSAPLADLLLLALAARALIVSRGRSAAGWLLTAGLAAWFVTNVAFAAVGTGSSGRLDVGWVLGMQLLALATLSREDHHWAAPQDVPASRHVVTRMLGVTLPLGMPPLAHLLTHRDQGAVYAPYVGMGVLMLLTLVRVGGLLAAQERARTEVTRSRQYFQALADNTVDALLVVDERLEIVFRSRRVEWFVGDLRQRNLSALVGEVLPQIRARLDDALERTVIAPGNVVQEEFELAPEHSRGRHRWVLARFVNLLDDPAVRGILISLSDCSARKQAELELERARDAALAGSRAKSTFLATMSHEIRTPLNGVLGLTELILTTDLDEQQSRYAEGVRVAGEALLQVISDILDFSKIEAGRLELDEAEFDLARLLDETAGLVAPAAHEKGLELLVHCAPDLPSGLRGDQTRLRQVLLNLASNAIKFTRTGEVLLTARLDGPLVSDVAAIRLEVVDSGIGIDPDQREHLFDAFTQADSSTTRRFGGTGLGLAISRQLVTAMGGEIGVEPRSGSGGSRFWVSLPLPVAAVLPRPTTGQADAWTGRSVLVVDDSATCRQLLSEQLTHWGMRVGVASSGHEAIALLRQAAAADEAYHLVLLDLSMPDLNGLELASRIRTAPDLTGTATVLLTPGSDPRSTGSLPAGVDARLVKPVRPHTLHEAISGVLLEQSAAPSVPAMAAARSSRGRILVVEDSEVNQLVAVGILESLGYDATVAEHGLAALDVLRTEPFDAVLMDCLMPTMDGYQATAEIRRLGLGGADLPVIAMTASVVAGDRERCLAAGMNDYVTKPATRAEVGAVLERWLARLPSPGA